MHPLLYIAKLTDPTATMCQCERSVCVRVCVCVCVFVCVCVCVSDVAQYRANYIQLLVPVTCNMGNKVLVKVGVALVKVGVALVKVGVALVKVGVALGKVDVALFPCSEVSQDAWWTWLTRSP